ncbi:MAG: phosphate/phosphite/phosphonate ABC transporter substrate-binding protein [Candidatus Nitrospinota bacterium M3_3B_026]
MRGLGTLPLVFLLALSLPPATSSAGPLKLGVHPYLSTTELVERFGPLAGWLGRRLGKPVTLEISRDYEEHISRIGDGKLDIAYIGPVSYVKLVERYGEKPILGRLEVNGVNSFRGVIIVHRDSPIDSLKNLRGKRFAFGDPGSTMSHLVPRYMLWEAGVLVSDLSDYAFLENHHNVALGVLMGDFDAGAVKEEVFKEYMGRGLRALETTPAVPEHLFVGSSALPPETVDKIRRAMSGLRDTGEGMAIMRSIKRTVTALTAADDADYDGLRKILRTYERISANR